MPARPPGACTDEVTGHALEARNRVSSAWKSRKYCSPGGLPPGGSPRLIGLFSRGPRRRASCPLFPGKTFGLVILEQGPGRGTAVIAQPALFPARRLGIREGPEWLGCSTDGDSSAFSQGPLSDCSRFFSVAANTARAKTRRRMQQTRHCRIRTIRPFPTMKDVLCARLI